MADGVEPHIPTIVIRARQGWEGLGLRGLAGYHELLYFLIWRDVKVRYKQSVIGIAWAVIQPLAYMLILTIFLGQIAGIRPDSVPYPLFVMAGLIPWSLFSQSVLVAGSSVVSNSRMVTKVYFPRLVFPISAVGARIFDFGIGMAIVTVIAIIFGFPPSLRWLWLVPLAMLTLLAALSVGLWFAALNVRYRDFGQIMPFFVQAWFFATPIAYGIEAVPANLRWLIALNPMTGVVAGFRWSITGVGEAPGIAVLISAALVAALLVSGLAFFDRVQRLFADVI